MCFFNCLCCLNSLAMRPMCVLVLSCIKIGVSANRWLSNGVQHAHYERCRGIQRHWGYLVKHVSLTIKRKHTQTATPPPQNAVVLITFKSCNAVYATRRERGHPRGVIKLYVRLTNGLVSNYEYSNGDDHVTNSIEPSDDVMTVAIVVLVALRVALLIEPSVNNHYRYMTPKIQFISNTSWCSKTISPGILGY